MPSRASWSGLRSDSIRFLPGLSANAWRQRARLLRSLELLAQDVPVRTVALDLGYSTASAFINLFKRAFGEPPSAYRRYL
ncbi:helix-turn-helix domain-containing protein [Duganella margarita]|nr:helix-turn-helix domain-containing protein [Duganella margarita]